jgi:hypothetical protein
VQSAGKGFNKLQMLKMESQALCVRSAAQSLRIQLQTILEHHRCRSISMGQDAESNYRRRVLVVSNNYLVTWYVRNGLNSTLILIINSLSFRPRGDQRPSLPNKHGSRCFLIYLLHRIYPFYLLSIKNSVTSFPTHG